MAVRELAEAIPERYGLVIEAYVPGAEAVEAMGCAPCTRAVNPGADPRAGRWWWESPETKECGLHVRRFSP